MAGEHRGINNEMTMHTCFAIACVVALLIIPAQASAYLDPSSGSMLLQIAVGGILAALFTVKTYWRKVRSVLRRKPSSE